MLGGKSGNVGGGKIMHYIMYQAKDFKPKRDMIKYPFSRNNYLWQKSDT